MSYIKDENQVKPRHLKLSGLYQKKWAFCEFTNLSGQVVNRQFTSFEISPKVHRVSLIVVNLCKSLRLSSDTINTAFIFVQRFYTFRSYHAYDPHVVALAAIFLSCKVRETCCECYYLAKRAIYQIPDLSSKYQQEPRLLVKDVLEYENVLLSTLGFDFPNSYIQELLQIGQILKVPPKLFQEAQRIFCASFLKSQLCLMYSQRVQLAIAFNIASYRLKMSIPDVAGKKWFKAIDSTLDDNFLFTVTYSLIQLIPENKREQAVIEEEKRDVVVKRERLVVKQEAIVVKQEPIVEV